MNVALAGLFLASTSLGSRALAEILNSALYNEVTLVNLRARPNPDNGNSSDCTE